MKKSFWLVAVTFTTIISVYAQSEIRINTGTPSGTIIYQGNTFEPDNYFSGGNLTESTLNPDGPYNSLRWSTADLAYNIPVDNGDYDIILHFNENAFGAVGNRVFHIELEGQRVETNFDIFALAPGQNVGLSRTYAVTVNDGVFSLLLVKTAVNNPSISGIEIVPASSSGINTGGITMERYDDIAGTSLDDLFNAPTYPDSPSEVVELSSFEIPTNIRNNYGVRMRGYIVAPESGTYYFWIASDDFSRLDIGSGTDFNGMVSIADVPDWTNGREWNKYAEQKSAGVDLIAGQIYAVAAYMKEGSGGDNLAVGWRRPSNGDGPIPVEVIPGNVLIPYGQLPNTIAVSGVSISQTSVSLQQGQTTNLSATVIPSDATNQGVSWSSSNASIASVNQSGVVTAVANGSTNITVSTQEGNYTATATVTVSESGGGDPPVSGDGPWVLSNNVVSLQDNTHTVSLGTNTVPSGYKLAIAGRLISEEIRVEMWNVADYVFEEGYPLLPLKEVAKHIEEKGHLPNIPSAEEMEANGAELGRMTNLLLEKIEELTLYTLEQQQLIDDLQAQVLRLGAGNSAQLKQPKN